MDNVRAHVQVGAPKPPSVLPNRSSWGNRSNGDLKQAAETATTNASIATGVKQVTAAGRLEAAHSSRLPEYMAARGVNQHSILYAQMLRWNTFLAGMVHLFDSSFFFLLYEYVLL